jgi:hypothetical protein
MGDRCAAEGVMGQWTGLEGEARGSMRDQQRATAFIWEFGLHIGQRSMQEAAMHNALRNCGCYVCM